MAYPKHLIEKHIDDILPVLKKYLKMKKWKFKFHIMASGDEEYKKFKFGKNLNACGLCYTGSTKAAEIFIFHDLQHDERDAVGTIVHEVLHAKFSRVRDLVTINSDIMGRFEENLIRGLEALILHYMGYEE